MIPRLATACGLILLAALSVVRVSRTPTPVPASAPDTVFSAERALRHVEQIAQRPHPMGTADHDRVRDYIAAQLSAMGIKPQIQIATAIGTRYQEAGRVQNILAYLPGTASSGKAVLLMAHYDGVEAGPAAADDGAGSAALLETMRALRSRKTPLKQDVIALFTDGEESGLLGAAAFVREHQWAKDAAFAINVEARGTTGRSYMFETGPGNLDAVRALRSAGDVTAGSVFTTIYRALPNDTDLSELSVLGIPALNFAFADGVERYHTTRDDTAHLNPGSLQHHGQQMLRVATKVAEGELPRPKTSDAVFFDLPLLGLVVYPTWVAIPLLIIAVVLFVVAARADFRDLLPGAGMMILALVVTALLARFVTLRGHAMWSGIYGAAIALGAIAINGAAYLAIRQRRPTAYVGALAIWLVAGAVTSIVAPGVSYLFIWPLLFALVALRSRRAIAAWLSAAFVLTMMTGLAYAAAVIMLGVSGMGAMALAVLAALVTWLVAPMLEVLFTSWKQALFIPLAAAVLLAIVGALTVRQTEAHPARSSIVYAENAETGEALLGSYYTREPWTNSVLGAVARGPEWTRALTENRALYGKAVPRAGLEAPTMTFIRDTIINGLRRVIVRVNAPKGTTAIMVHAIGERIDRAAIDARVVDTTRFRVPTPEWGFEFWNVPDSGAVFSLALRPDRKLDLEIAARRPGLPPGISIPNRPGNVVPSQTGDISVVYRRASF